MDEEESARQALARRLKENRRPPTRKKAVWRPLGGRILLEVINRVLREIKTMKTRIRPCNLSILSVSNRENKEDT